MERERKRKIESETDEWVKDEIIKYTAMYITSLPRKATHTHSLTHTCDEQLFYEHVCHHLGCVISVCGHSHFV